MQAGILEDPLMLGLIGGGALFIGNIIVELLSNEENSHPSEE